MKKILCFSLAFISFLNIYSQENFNERAIRAVYTDLAAAVVTHKSTLAVPLIDSATFAYYDKMLDIVLKDDRSVIDTLNYVDKNLVYTLQDGLAEEYMATLDGETLFSFLLENDLLAVKTFSTTKIGNVILDGDEALAQLVYPNNDSPYYLVFRKKDTTWQLDYTSMLVLTANGAKQACINREKLYEARGF